MVLNGLSGNQRKIAVSHNVSGVLSVAIVLREDSYYHYHVVVENTFGVVRSLLRSLCELLFLTLEYTLSFTILLLVTTDVQSVNVTYNGNNIYTIQCSFINNSDAFGCAYFLVSTSLENITGIIERTNIKGVLIEIPIISCFYKVMAYDFEMDNTTDTLPIIGNINSTITDETPCYVTGIVIILALL